MKKTSALVTAGVFFFCYSSLGQDHPGNRVEDEVKSQDVEMSILEHIDKDETLKNRFMIYDEKEEMARVLNFEGFHTVNELKDGSYFVCVDFEDHNKNKLDVDIYLDETEEGLEISKMLIHKVNGKSRQKKK